MLDALASDQGVATLALLVCLGLVRLLDSVLHYRAVKKSLRPPPPADKEDS